MGLLSLFSKPSSSSVQRLPEGSLTVDRNGEIVASTISSAFTRVFLQEIGALVLGFFREARKSQIPLTELNLYFGSLQLTAREMRGGAVVFLKPKDSLNPSADN